MADKNTRPAKTPKRVGDYNPDVELGSLLDDIADEDVTVATAFFDNRRGRNGNYTLTVITLDDGRIFHTGSPVIAERLAAIPAGEFPVLATFSKEQSKSNPQQSYWTVN